MQRMPELRDRAANIIDGEAKTNRKKVDAEIVAKITNQLLWLWIVKETQTNRERVATAVATAPPDREEMKTKSDDRMKPVIFIDGNSHRAQFAAHTRHSQKKERTSKNNCLRISAS